MNIPTTRTASHLAGLVLATLLAGCASAPSGPVAIARLDATRGNTTNGILRFEQRGPLVRVSGEISGLPPNSEHGFHVHEKGDCTSGDGMSAGGHFNPDASAHGQHSAAVHHAGDLPSLRADSAGVVRVSFETESISIGAGPHDVVGRGLIVHRDPDDYTTQPTGNSGPRVACGAITRAQ